MRPSVDLPQPDSPTRPTTSPLATARSTLIDGVHRLLAHVGAELAGDAAGEIGLAHEALGQAAALDDGGARSCGGSGEQRVEAAHGAAAAWAR